MSTEFENLNLPQFVSHKVVGAAQIQVVIPPARDGSVIVTLDGGQQLTLPAPVVARYTPKVGDYLVQYDGDYLSISPKAAFESGYQKIVEAPAEADPAVFDFPEALRQIKAGKRVARVGWNGKGMFLFLVPGSSFVVNRPPLLGIYPPGTQIDYHGHIDMKTAQGYVVPWLASQADLLSEDWVLVPDTVAPAAAAASLASAA